VNIFPKYRSVVCVRLSQRLGREDFSPETSYSSLNHAAQRGVLEIALAWGQARCCKGGGLRRLNQQFVIPHYNIESRVLLPIKVPYFLDVDMLVPLVTAHLAQPIGVASKHQTPLVRIFRQHNVFSLCQY
jgi:hypothetical protein